MRVVFDLDDTLSDSRPRVEKYLYKPGGYADPAQRITDPDWNAFFQECEKDKAICSIATIFQALRNRGEDIEIWSARCASVRSHTEHWLDRNSLVPNNLFMRPEGDRTDDHELKEKWLLDSIRYRNWKPGLVFEDRTRLVNMYRSHGIRCVQVAPGDF